MVGKTCSVSMSTKTVKRAVPFLFTIGLPIFKCPSSRSITLEPLIHGQCQPMFARMPRSVVHIIVAFAVTVTNLVVTESIFRSYLKVMVSKRLDGSEQH